MSFLDVRTYDLLLERNIRHIVMAKNSAKAEERNIFKAQKINW